MRYPKKIVPPMIAAGVAMLALANTAIVQVAARQCGLDGRVVIPSEKRRADTAEMLLAIRG